MALPIAPESFHMSLNIGDIIDGKYQIARLLGEGGMGAVYEGENLRIHRKVAIKILHSNVAQSQDAVQRFEREAQAAGRIGSDHIVEVLDLGELPGGDRYMVMEFLDGESLSARIANSGGLSPQKTASLVIGILEGLGAAHNAGIVHRDLKPDNVFLLSSKGGQADFVKIVDFGISKFNAMGGEFSMTQTGAVMGTPYYLSPEQAKGERHVDHLSDLYAVGVILWETVAGKVPFDGDTFNELLFKIVLEPVPELSTIKSDLDPHFVSIVHKAMARERNLRFQSAAEMQQALQSWLQGQPPAPEMLADAEAARFTRSQMSSFADTSLGRTATAQSTSANWANTQTPGVTHNSNKRWIVIGSIAVAAAAAFGMVLSRQNAAAEAEATARANTEEERIREAAADRKAELARLEAETAKAAAERAQAEQAKSEADRKKAEVQLSAAEQARKAAAEAAEPQQPSAVRRPAATRPSTTAARPPARAETTRPTTSSPTSAGRTIRTDL